MSKNLVIVESPAKAKTGKYLGQDFQVLSSIGHIRSIAKKAKDGKPPIEVDNDFFVITAKLIRKRKKLLTNLKKPLKPLVKKTFGLQPMKTAKEKPLLGIYAKYST